ncbi:MAG: nitrile hydratase subunit alpha, partial [Mycobacterium sp.]|nr:nitrile hydratase subunit alpha [Mycobacterium sp.]
MSADHHHPQELAPVEARIAAIESVLVEKGILEIDAVDEIVKHFEDNIGPMNGAKVVARAWTDAAYRERLLSDGTAAINELGFSGPEGDYMVVVENTPQVHNLVVCTLCSCYP